MNRDNLFVKIVLNAWELNIKRATSTFESFSDDDIYTEVSPGKNRVVYLLGHLIAVHDMMQPLLGMGQRLYSQLDDTFITNPDKKIKTLPPLKELRAYWTNLNDVLMNKFHSMPVEEWFQKHSSISEEDFAKEPHRNKLSVLITRINHLTYHLGQIALVKK
jgi:DinB superfamily